MLLVLALRGLFACSPSSLDSVPIRNAPSPDVEGAIRDELEQFERDAGAERVELDEVAFRPLGGDVLGKYIPPTKRVLLDETLDLSLEVQRVVRHELCHALDYQDGLLDDTGVAEMFFRLADETGLGELPLPHREAMAYLCEGRPESAALSQAVTCPGDPADLRAAGEWTLHEVYDSTSPTPVFEASEPPVSYDWTAPFTQFELSPTVDPQVVALQWWLGSDATKVVAVDLYSGEALIGAPEPPPAAAPTTVPALSPGLFVWTRATDVDGRAVALVSLEIQWLHTPARVLAFDGEWSALGGACHSEPLFGANVFIADGHLWHAWLEPGTSEGATWDEPVSRIRWQMVLP